MARRPDDICRDQDTTPEDRPALVQRRKLGRIIRNERGNATMEWTTYTEQDSAERVVLQVLETPADGNWSVVKDQPDEDPAPRAARQPWGAPGPHEPQAQPPRRPSDLRKLSEWIKLTRKLESAKQKKRWF